MRGDIDLSSANDCTQRSLGLLADDALLPDVVQLITPDTAEQIGDLFIEFFADTSITAEDAQARFVDIIASAQQPDTSTGPQNAGRFHSGAGPPLRGVHHQRGGKALSATRPNQLFRNKSAKIAAIPMMVTAFFVFVGGTIWTVVYSFTSSGLLSRLQWVGLDQYERLWSTRKWLVAIENLAIYGVCMLVLIFVIGFILAAQLGQKIRFEDTIRTIILYPYALSFVVTGLVLAKDFEPRFQDPGHRAPHGVGELQFRSALQREYRDLWGLDRRDLAKQRPCDGPDAGQPARH